MQALNTKCVLSKTGPFLGGGGTLAHAKSPAPRSGPALWWWSSQQTIDQSLP